jgi:uncharacterized protein (TIGR03118 family)
MTIRRSTAALAWVLMLPAAPAAAGYIEVDLVSDVPGLAQRTDANLVNPWGIALSPEGLRVANNGTGVSTAYTGAGVPDPLVITILPAPGSPAETHSTPTGVVRNGAADTFLTNFLDPNSAATLMFSTLQGTITAWNAGLGTTAINEVNNASVATYTGLAINQASDLIYAANFAAGTIDVFQGTAPAFGPALTNHFVDPNLPGGYSPFNIQDLNGTLYVTYAQVDPQTGEEMKGPGLGIVDAFDEAGVLIRRVTSGGSLNAPWGVAMAPADFGTFSNALLVGNFGDGRINAFDPLSGTFLGQLGDPGQPLAIAGLWGLQFGDDGAGGAHNQLFFAAGIDDERHGLFGRIEASAAVDEPGSLALALLGAVLLVLAHARRTRA